MGTEIEEYASTWCAGLQRKLTEARDLVLKFDSQLSAYSDGIAKVIQHAKANPEYADTSLIRCGVAATLAEFEEEAFDHPFANYSNIVALALVQDAVGVEPDGSPKGPVASHALVEALNQLIEESKTLCPGMPGLQLGTTSLPAALRSLQGAPAPVPSPITQTSPLYVPPSKRRARWSTALWTLGILLVIALIGKYIIVWLALIAAAAFFISSALFTSAADGDEFERKQGAARRTQQMKDDALSLDERARGLLKAIRVDFDKRQEEAVQQVNETCRQLFEIVRGGKNSAPSAGDLILGECAVAPLASAVVIEGLSPNFSAFAGVIRNAVALEDRSAEDKGNFFYDAFTKKAHALAGCIARVKLSACDKLEVIVAEQVDASDVGQRLASEALKACAPGKARFMFVEPGRLAEAYRVFGGLNESPATRLADRLYVTHVNEMAAAVDALRTFVGRTKEALTRQARPESRLADQDLSDSTIQLQRAIVVLDRTQGTHWPEKDRRRLAEYFDEIETLAEVGAREGSVFLLKVTPAALAKGEHPKVTGRSAVIFGTPFGYVSEGAIRASYPAPESPAALAAQADAWVKSAKKVDSTLRQRGAALDWSDREASDSRYGLEVEIGRYGADRPAYLTLGREGAHHAISIGRTGSGKTNLFHVIISNLIRRYSPEELELYLLDFKEGVEFAVYADLALPHCRAIAIDADKGFGLSVLSHLRRELNRRANVFKSAGVGIANLERYEEVTGENMPRIVLLIDEFQVLLQGGDRVAGSAPGAAAAALEDLVRRGRSFGLHIILGSQTLAGRELTAATLGQLAVRIVLPCSAPDAAMLLGDQPVSNQLRAPGDAIVWCSGQGDVSDAHLAKIYAADLQDLPDLAAMSRAQLAAEGKAIPVPFVFRGSGQTEVAEVMPHLVTERSGRRETSSTLFALGAPTAFGEKPLGEFRPLRSRNLLFVHRSDETRGGFFYSALDSLLAIQSETEAIICDLEGARDAWGELLSERLVNCVGSRRARVIGGSELEGELDRLAGQLAVRANAPPTILAINCATRAQLVRSAAFARLLKEGPESGTHIIATCDSVKNLERFVERSGLGEFGLRCLGPATGADSQRLLDSNDAEMLTADNQYLVYDEFTPGKLTRLQVLTPSLQTASDLKGDVLETVDA